MAAPKIRLYIEQPLSKGHAFALNAAQSHYLCNVMRLKAGDQVAVFNGKDGVWQAVLAKAHKRAAELVSETQIAPQTLPPDLWLLFAPIKKARTDFIVEKAAEIGVRRIMPVQTRYTNSERIRVNRLQAHAVEAAEQCGSAYVPKVCPLRPLREVLTSWPEGRQLVFCDEARVGEPVAPTLNAPGAVLIGPEGGFSPEERTQIAAHPAAHPISLGPRILRADTAAVAALSLWQFHAGDWQ